ncbi:MULTISPECIES: tyrosine-type recombinase/integrase [Hominilimicola]|jgi:site-specific recombinase XerD|uniref:Tyrosine-type recombinase/integrase n=1 Tax=Hominilimicola fabiformis TaxID=2885356 RepID=A0AAE3E083_9FIRM|nr:tyrosine-type recombinase/integrase [Hominilimicola fabiformis]MCC2211142.1 tyrosine-type recombinase/integrase [Hominilimicola fabiformis]DAV23118.1 MAG TPA: SITE SPECIFIC RECOMBINASE XERD [Caudoviricetes sp.]
MDGKPANRSEEITDEEWLTVNEFNRDMVEDYLNNQVHLSPKSLIAYRSALRIFFVWVKNNLHDKNCTEIRKKEFLRYLNWLAVRGFSESGIKFKKSSVSAFNKFIENFYEDDYPQFRNYVTSEMQIPKTGRVYTKEPLTPEEIEHLCKVLEEREEWQKLAYVKFTYSTGCRRAESRQLLKEVVNYTPKRKMVTIIDENGKEQEVESVSYKTHEIRCKGRSSVGKVRHLQFGQDVMDTLKKWLEIRGEDDCPYMFVIKQKNGETHQVGEGTFNDWCIGEISEIVGRRCTPHNFRRSRATNLVCHDHRSLETAQKLLGHESSETTQIYVIREDSDDADEAFI